MNPISKMAEGVLRIWLTGEDWERYSQIIWTKYPLALQTWAVVRLGKEREKFFELAYDLFLMNLAMSGLLNTRNPDEVLALVNAVPFLIPPSTKSKLRVPLSGQNPDMMLRDYQFAMLKISEAKRKAKREPLTRFPVQRGPRIGTSRWLIKKRIQDKNRTNYKMAIAERSPGYPTSRINSAMVKGWKPSLIALDYVAWKYKWPLSVESLKKQLAQMKPPEKVSQRLRADLNKALKESLSIGR